MRDWEDTVGMPDVQSRRAFFRFEIVDQDRPLEMKLESAPDFSHADPNGPKFSLRRNQRQAE